MSVIWLQRREPTRNLRILIGFVYRLVVAPYCVAAVGIVVAEFDRLKVCTLGHDALSKMLVKCRKGTAVCKGIRGVYEMVGRAGEKGAMWLVLCQLL